MVILIDAYNVLKHLYGATVSERHKEHLLALLNRYVKRKPHTIYLVFDGGDSVNPTQYKKGSIAVIYAGYRKSADDVLIDLMKKSWAFDGLLVSNDRALRAHASPANIDCLAVKLFYDIISEQPSASRMSMPTESSNKKYVTTQSNAQLDELLMGDMGKVIAKDETSDGGYSTSDRMSKSQKRYHAKLKRL